MNYGCITLIAHPESVRVNYFFRKKEKTCASDARVSSETLEAKLIPFNFAEIFESSVKDVGVSLSPAALLSVAF